MESSALSTAESFQERLKGMKSRPLAAERPLSEGWRFFLFGGSNGKGWRSSRLERSELRPVTIACRTGFTIAWVALDPFFELR